MDDDDGIAARPAAERPRERLVAAGAGALSDRELLAVVLGTGSKGEDVLRLAGRLLDAIGGREGLARARYGRLARLPGLGPGQATRLLAVVELGRRCLLPQAGRSAPVRHPLDLRAALLAHLGGVPREVFGMFMLDARMRMIGFQRVSEGTVFSTTASCRDTFDAALGSSAAAVILAHNHPSGDPTPSAEDVDATRRLIAAGAALELPVLDHLVLGGDQVVSLKEAGLMG